MLGKNVSNLPSSPCRNFHWAYCVVLAAAALLIPWLTFQLWYYTPPDILHHPIDALIVQAENKFQGLLSAETQTLQEAIETYEERRGRVVPPGFAAWYVLARKYSAVMVEEFWDPIYQDLDPFWSIEPSSLRRMIDSITRIPGKDMVDGFWIRNGTAETNCFDYEWCEPYTEFLAAVVREAPAVVPSVQIAATGVVSPRTWVPWERLQAAKDKCAAAITDSAKHSAVEWVSVTLDLNITEAVQAACAPTSALRRGLALRNINHMTSDGVFVQDYDLSKMPCHQPELLKLHGSFVAPREQLYSTDLLPLFSEQSTAHLEHVIRTPAALDWVEDWKYHSEEDTEHSQWSSKLDKAVWRGSNTGSRVTAANWKKNHRHRLVAMTSAHNIEKAAQSGNCSWAMPSRMCERLQNRMNGAALLEFCRNHVDIGFSVSNVCEDPDEEYPKLTEDEIELATTMNCSYLEVDYEYAGFIPLSQCLQYKFLVDVDGYGFSEGLLLSLSARFLTFIRSHSVPIKASIFREWHDSRLIPWKHFVPMDNRYDDLWDVLFYFIGTCHLNEPALPEQRQSCITPHDDEAKRIGLSGAEWAARVLRKEDMILYMVRLLLEYKRLTQDNREGLRDS
ncbi:glycosyltransferase family 90 protein (capsular associated protein) [Colletotrichum truncatum]|uniref:Glycosyltransferase family 90 protein (Capsular associated protein) n=1 Tax=Colletotrichum truncatum TaxID=5467 RepID=A0ACC3YBW6_COLTU